MKSRQIIITDDKFPNKEWRTKTNAPYYSLWCDPTNCDKCIVRFQCHTSRDILRITYPSDIVDEKIEEFRTQKWRLRDGSSRARENRNIHL